MQPLEFEYMQMKSSMNLFKYMMSFYCVHVDICVWWGRSCPLSCAFYLEVELVAEFEDIIF